MSVKFFLKNTKIVSTFGPAITSDLNLKGAATPDPKLVDRVRAIIAEMVKAGINCVRYNFSHGALDENSTRLEMIHRVEREFISGQKGERRYIRALSMMADTKGPEIRVFDMGAGVSYDKGQEVIVDCLEKKQGSLEGFSVVDATGKYNMANDCVVGNSILVEDGKLRLNIVSVDKASGKVGAVVMNNHFLKTNKRINLPGANYSMDFLSDKDVSDIKYSIDNGFEYVALSFVNSKRDVYAVKDLIAEYCKEKGIPNLMKVYSKIETTQSCKNIDEIIEASDGIMIARGDLGLEVPYFEVPFWTKQIIHKCRVVKKPVITATQMLDSLERNVVATRAEVSDVYRAAELGSDCTMLSGETAQGQFPVLSVDTMTNIVFESEKHINSAKFLDQFYAETFSNLDSGVQTQISRLREALEKHSNTNVILMKGEGVSVEFLKSISSMRLKSPVFLFQTVDNVEKCCREPKWNCGNYVKMKEAMALSLFRGINVIFVDGKFEGVTCPDMFRECFEAYIDDCCPECCAKNMLCLEEMSSEWKFVN